MKYVDGFACLLSVQSWCFPTSLSISDWAAWVQAIGSVLAVFAAIFVVAFQLFHEQRRAAALEITHLQAIWTLVYHCRVEMQYVATAAHAGGPFLGEPGGLGPKVAALRAIPILEIPSVQAVIAVLTVIEAYEAFQSGIEPQPIAGTGLQFPRMHRIESHANACQMSFEFAERRLRLSLEDRGAGLPNGSAYSINSQPYQPLDAA